MFRGGRRGGRGSAHGQEPSFGRQGLLFRRGGGGPAGKAIGHAGFIIGGTSRGIAGGIGLVSESIHAYSDNKKQEKATGPSTDYTERRLPVGHYSENSSETTDQYWELDDVQHDAELDGGVPYGSLPDGRTALSNAIARPPPAYPGQLELPVIIPQRRPKDRKRGFVRAYAPVLRAVDIDEGAWMGFLDEFEKSCIGSPWLHTLNAAALAAFALPMGWSQLVAMSVNQAVSVAREIDGRRK